MKSYDKLVANFMEVIQRENNHALFRFCALPYYLQFFEMMRLLYDSGCLDNHSKITRFARQLQLNGNYDFAQYLEGVSEIIFQYFALRRQMNFDLDKNINEGNGTDVDIQIHDKDFCYNIEIKTPKFVNDDYDSSILKVNLSHRTMNKDALNRQKDFIENEICDPIINQASSPFSDIKYTKIEDNKLISFLKSAQKKFVYSNENCVNILVVAIPSSKMQDYWSYLYNIQSGLFTPNYDDTLIGISKNEFDKVDTILLTNLLSGHIHPVDKKNSWNLESYCNILCNNPNSQQYKIFKSDVERYEKIRSFIPNSNYEFEELYKKYDQQNPIFMQCILSDLLANNFPEQWWND